MSFRHFFRRHPDLWIVRLFAILTALMGIINVLSAITPAMTSRLILLEQFSPLEVHRSGHLTAAVAGFALIILAGSLWRRKRIAWLITLVVLLISSLSHLLKGLDYEEALLAGGLAAGLFIFRRHFHARSDRPSIRQGLVTVAIALTFTLAYGALGFFLLDKHYSVHYGFWTSIHQTVVMFTQFYDPGLTPLTGYGRYFADSIYVVGAVAMGYALLMLVRPVFLHEPATIAERTRAKTIVEAHGCSPLARLTLMDDKSYFFSQGGSVVAFASRGRIALALGDVIGPSEDAQACISAFKAHCARNDWEVVFYQVRTDYLDIYLASGFKSLCIGQEAIVDLATFTIAGGEKKSIRTSVNRMTKLKYCTEVFPAPIPNDLLAELRDVSDEWLTNMKSVEMRFSVGWFDNEYIRNGPVMVVRDPQGEICAFVNIVPEYQRNEVTIDLMRQRSENENGLMDFLFVSLFGWAKEAGYATFNLGLSALAGIDEKSDERALEWALRYIYEHEKRLYNFKGVHTFKAKYQPIWQPRYLIYSNTAQLPAIALAMAQAEMGKDNLLSGYWPQPVKIKLSKP